MWGREREAECQHRPGCAWGDQDHRMLTLFSSPFCQVATEPVLSHILEGYTVILYDVQVGTLKLRKSM